ncbi:MAG: outer membrane protein assembly factor BamD [Bacteroidia bacterium]|nr:outer membrane protein assembly factor BamD [Bacteroidia bacterium]MBT8228821.1 outer membrane protein assembly factor BamD [Bacteroidia bacterium]
MTLFLLLSCKTHFEQMRTSNDPVKILEAANEYYEKEDYLKAQALYEVIIPFYRGKQEAEDLFYNYAYTYYHQDQFLLAAHYFNSFNKTFYNSTKKEETAFMSAYANYEMSPSYKLDQGPSIQAINELQTFINAYPNSPRVEECNGLIDEMRLKLETKSYEQGKLYFQLQNFNSAMTSFENMLKDFPETKRTEEVRFLIIKSSYLQAKNSVYEKTKERLDGTVLKCNKFLTKYSESGYLAEVENILENCKKELKRFTDDGYQE